MYDSRRLSGRSTGRFHHIRASGRTYERDVQRQGRAAVCDHDGGVGHRRHGRRGLDRRSVVLAGAELRHPVAHLWPSAAAAYECGDFRVRRLRPHGDFVLRRTKNQSRAPVRRPIGGVRVLGMASRDSRGGDFSAPGLHPGQGICRTRMADRHPDHAGLGRLCGSFFRYVGNQARQAHLCCQLVLRRLHHHHCGTPCIQQPGSTDKPDEILRHLLRRRRRHDGVVVRPQRRGIFSHGGLSGNDVLLRAEAGAAAHLLVSPVRRAFLGVDFGLHVGRSRTICITHRCRIGCSR